MKGLQSALAASPKAVEFFVSPQGNDAWSGRVAASSVEDGPFATIGRARDAVRAWRTSQVRPVPVRIVLRAGSYYLDQPLEFGQQDSGSKDAPVVYSAAEGEKVVLSGGRLLRGGRWGEINGRKAWVLDIPEVKASKWNFHQLFVNGERRPRTRLPKEGFYHVESVPDYDAKQPDDDQHNNVRRFIYGGSDIKRWHNLQDVDLVAVETCQSNRLPIQEVDAQKRMVTFDRTSRDRNGVRWLGRQKSSVGVVRERLPGAFKCHGVAERGSLLGQRELRHALPGPATPHRPSAVRLRCREQ